MGLQSVCLQVLTVFPRVLWWAWRQQGAGKHGSLPVLAQAPGARTEGWVTARKQGGTLNGKWRVWVLQAALDRVILGADAQGSFEYSHIRPSLGTSEGWRFFSAFLEIRREKKISFPWASYSQLDKDK